MWRDRGGAVRSVDRARRKHPTSLEAYECLLKGNLLPWDDPASAAEATGLFEKAIEIDPGYGMAHGLLAVMRAARITSTRRSPSVSLNGLETSAGENLHGSTGSSSIGSVGFRTATRCWVEPRPPMSSSI